MRKYFIISYILFFTGNAFPQQPSKPYLDSLYHFVLHANELLSETIKDGQPLLDTLNIKCGFGIANAIRQNLDYFTPLQKEILLSQIQRPATDTSFITPNNFFRVHFFKTGPNAPGYNLTELALALDSAYNFEVNYLGYPPPPGDSIVNKPDSIYGGDNRYDIYITNLNPYSDGYGYTAPETERPVGSNKFTSFIVIDNDYGNGYNTNGINAARVTVAHEFHHSIQIGDYIDNYQVDGFFYELTSTSMEHFVFPSIHDFYYYMPAYFNHPYTSFSKNNGYDLAVWNIYLQEKFGQYQSKEGFNIIKRQWQLMPQMRAVKAINTSLNEINSSFGRELNEFGIWTYFTGYRTYPGKYFSEAENYPLIQTNPLITFNPPQQNVSLNVYPLSNNFVKFYIPAQINDTLVAVITNGNVIAGVDSQYTLYPITYNLYTYSENGSIKITDNYYEKLVSENPNLYFDSEILNNLLVKQDTILNKIGSNSDFAFPNPFYYSKYYQNGQYISFPVKIPLSQKADVNIYSISMGLIFSGTLKTYAWSKDYNIIRWNVMDSKNKKISTGVYVYFIKYGDQTFKGKFVVFQ